MPGLNLNTKDVIDKLKSAFMESSHTPEASAPNPEQEPQAPPAPPQPLKPTAVFAAILNGLGVGMLLGVLLGLAVSPVVSGVIGTLSSILVVLLGLNDKHITTLKSLRIGSFGLFAVLGILAGMYIRVSELLAPTISELKNEYVQAGYSDDQALYYVALKKFDYVPVGWFGTSDKDTVALSKTDKHDQSVLFSSEVELDVCDNLNEVDSTFPRIEIFYSFENAGGFWKKLAAAIPDELPDQVYVDGLLGIRDSFCALGNQGKATIGENKQLATLTTENTAGQIIKSLKQAGGAWESILDNTEEKIPAEHQVTFYLTVIKILNHE